MSEGTDINAVIESIVVSINELKKENERLKTGSIDGASMKSMQLTLEKKEHELAVLVERSALLEKEVLKLKQENEHYLAKINQLATLVAKEKPSEGTFAAGVAETGLKNPTLTQPRTEDLKVASPKIDTPSNNFPEEVAEMQEPRKPMPATTEVQAPPPPQPSRVNPFDGQDSDDPFIEGGDMDDDEFFKSIQR